MTSLKTVGILALQGCVEPHIAHLKALGVETLHVRKQEDFDKIDALIIPGGESTTMLKLLNALGMKERLKKFLSEKPTWGICAGAILMAKTVTHPAQESFSALDMAIERNAYGRQLESFETQIHGSTVAFIRAPQIKHIGTGVKVLATQGEMREPVWIQEGRHYASTFHPELSKKTPSEMHRTFVENI